MTNEQLGELQHLVDIMVSAKRRWKLSKDGAERGKAHDEFFREREKLMDFINRLE